MYRLLIVDGEKTACEEIVHILDWKRYGFSSVVTASSYSEAVNKVVDLPPHVALVNVRLGDRWGWELISQLRRQGLRTVFAIVSDSEDIRWIRKSMQACAQDFLLKPLDVREVRAFIERVIVNEFGGTLPDSRVLPEHVDPVLKVEYRSLSKITNKIILYTHNNYRMPLSLTGIAEVFKMSSKYIGRIFLRDTGMKYSEYLMAWRMIEASRRIVGTRDKISVIAGMVGYSQLNNFYIHFKRYFGFSPGDLRNSDNSIGMGVAGQRPEDKK